jgi:hypothetical protein
MLVHLIVRHDYDGSRGVTIWLLDAHLIILCNFLLSQIRGDHDGP